MKKFLIFLILFAGCNYAYIDTIKVMQNGVPVENAYVDFIYTNSGYIPQNNKGPTNLFGLFHLEKKIPVNQSVYATVKVNEKKFFFEYNQFQVENGSVLILDIKIID